MATTKLNPFQQCIKDYLDKRAAKDELFAKTYAKQNKNIVECCEYIVSEAKKKASGNVAAIKDEEVYGWAVHYYDEDDIKVGKPGAVKVTAPAAPTAKAPAAKAPKASKTPKAAKPKAKKVEIEEAEVIPELDISFDLF